MKVLVIDDDPVVSETVSLCFEVRWPDSIVLSAKCGKEGLDLFARERADIVILGLNLPDLEGLDVFGRMRYLDSEIRIVTLASADRPQDGVRSLEAGADGFVLKPLDDMLFLARVNAVMRRGPQPVDDRARGFDNGYLSIDFLAREVRLGEKPVRLTPTEWSLLQQLAGHSNRPVSHRDLLLKVWGPEYLDATEYLKVHVQHLRRKLHDDSVSPRIIATERGVGYRFVAASGPASPKEPAAA